MNDKWFYVTMFSVGLICAGIGAVVQYTFDNITIQSQKDLLEDYKEWLQYYWDKYPFNNSFFMFNLPNNSTMKNLDSDGDGLTDFAEFYIFYTNPFVSNGYRIDENTNYTITIVEG